MLAFSATALFITPSQAVAYTLLSGGGLIDGTAFSSTNTDPPQYFSETDRRSFDPFDSNGATVNLTAGTSSAYGEFLFTYNTDSISFESRAETFTQDPQAIGSAFRVNAGFSFSLSSTTLVQLLFSNVPEGYLFYSYGGGYAFLQLYEGQGENGAIFTRGAERSSNPPATLSGLSADGVSFEARLSPGTYAINFEGGSAGVGGYLASGSLKFNTVPEPGAMLLVGASVFALRTRRRATS